ncbi:hypothetical protein KXR96_21465 [Brucella intermedia]
MSLHKPSKADSRQRPDCFISGFIERLGCLLKEVERLHGDNVQPANIASGAAYACSFCGSSGLKFWHRSFTTKFNCYRLQEEYSVSYSMKIMSVFMAAGCPDGQCASPREYSQHHTA